MYFLLVYQLLTAEVPGWVQLGAYTSEEQCKVVANKLHEATPETTLGFICASSAKEGTKI